jgi:hypothetical protein
VQESLQLAQVCALVRIQAVTGFYPPTRPDLSLCALVARTGPQCIAVCQDACAELRCCQPASTAVHLPESGGLSISQLVMRSCHHEDLMRHNACSAQATAAGCGVSKRWPFSATCRAAAASDQHTWPLTMAFLSICMCWL